MYVNIFFGAVGFIISRWREAVLTAEHNWTQLNNIKTILKMHQRQDV